MTNWLTLEEAAQYPRMNQSTLYELARKVKVAVHKIGQVWRFDAEELDERFKSVKFTLSEEDEE